jgi:hypothetical protein
MIKLTRPDCPNLQALKKDYKHPTNREALKTANSDKCMYCESKISHSSFPNIEHIKPKAKFPELMYEWENLGYVCERCNNAKLDKFYEDTPFIDPYSEDPSLHLGAFGSLLFTKNGSERGEITIHEIHLNRLELLERRKNRIDAIQKATNACFRTKSEKLKNLGLEELLREAEPDKEYSVFVKALFASLEV